jgi:murein DD-endopeptidase MepM/ murein hydrolase activator NlpD
MQKPERLLGCRPSPNGRERKKLAVLQQTWVSGRTSKSRGLLHGTASDAVEREAELMKRHRTTARPALFLILAAGLLAGSAAARSGGTTKPIVFPILGAAHYVDDFGDARPGGMHQGIDMMAAKKSLALAAEAGKVKFWTSSAAAGCMLYLYGASGTTYYYIHLNNDLTRGNDNRGKCIAGTAYAPGLKNGATVAAGQPVGFVGDSGDANGIHAHLHFEVHPGGARAVDGYPILQTAQHLLFAAPKGKPFTLELDGTVTKPGALTLQLKLSTVHAWPMGQRQTRLRRPLLLNVPSTALVQSTNGSSTRKTTILNASKGQTVKVWTMPATASLKTERGDDLSLTAALVLLRSA